jgi:hypothetical protein
VSPSPFPGFSACCLGFTIDREIDYFHERCVNPPQAYVVLLDDKFYRVSQGCVSLDKNGLSGNESHFHEPPPERTGPDNPYDSRAFALFHVSQGHVENLYNEVME